MTMTSATRLSAIGVPFEQGGQRFMLGALDFRVELALQRSLEQNAYRRLQAHRGEMDADDYGRALDGWRHDLAVNTFAYGTSVCFRYLASQEGMRALALLLLQSGQRQGGATAFQETMDRIVADPEKWDELVGLVMEHYFPNAQAPARPEATPADQQGSVATSTLHSSPV
jgi:hypothetical protein